MTSNETRNKLSSFSASVMKRFSSHPPPPPPSPTPPPPPSPLSTFSRVLCRRFENPHRLTLSLSHPKPVYRSRNPIFQAVQTGLVISQEDISVPVANPATEEGNEKAKAAATATETAVTDMEGNEKAEAEIQVVKADAEIQVVKGEAEYQVEVREIRCKDPTCLFTYDATQAGLDLFWKHSQESH